LMITAENWVKDCSRQVSIFPDENPNWLSYLNHRTFIGIKYNFSFFSGLIQSSVGCRKHLIFPLSSLFATHYVRMDFLREENNPIVEGQKIISIDSAFKLVLSLSF